MSGERERRKIDTKMRHTIKAITLSSQFYAHRYLDTINFEVVKLNLGTIIISSKKVCSAFYKIAKFWVLCCYRQSFLKIFLIFQRSEIQNLSIFLSDC